MVRRFTWLVLFIGFCVITPISLLAQQGASETPSGTTDQPGSIFGDVQGPQIISGEDLRAQSQPGEGIGTVGAGAGALRGQAEAAIQTGPGGGVGGVGGRQTGRGGINNLRNVMQNFGMYNSMFQQQRQIRVPISLGFSPASILPPSPEVGARVEGRLARIPQLRDNGPLAVEMDGRVAVLRGEVVSQHQRELVARLVLLEPGISDVRNELQVAPEATLP